MVLLKKKHIWFADMFDVKYQSAGKMWIDAGLKLSQRWVRAVLKLSGVVKALIEMYLEKHYFINDNVKLKFWLLCSIFIKKI